MKLCEPDSTRFFISVADDGGLTFLRQTGTAADVTVTTPFGSTTAIRAFHLHKRFYSRTTLHQGLYDSHRHVYYLKLPIQESVDWQSNIEQGSVFAPYNVGREHQPLKKLIPTLGVLIDHLTIAFEPSMI